MRTGIVYNIQKFCVDDGPGIRTTIYLKGCNLRCRWCHNAESLSHSPVLGFFKEKCIQCQGCALVCPNHVHIFHEEGHFLKRANCMACGLCTKVCPTGALKISGTEMSSEEVFCEIEKDRVFYETSGGGVTFSGGEPLLQADFCAETAEKCRNGKIPVAVETAGYVNWEALEQMLPFTDLWLFDIKETIPENFRRYTDGELSLVLENLRRLDERNCNIVLRCPIIPGVNDRESHFLQLKELKKKYKSIQKIQIMPYHNIGEHKKDIYGISHIESYRVPTVEEIKKWENAVKEQ